MHQTKGLSPINSSYNRAVQESASIPPLAAEGAGSCQTLRHKGLAKIPAKNGDLPCWREAIPPYRGSPPKEQIRRKRG